MKSRLAWVLVLALLLSTLCGMTAIAEEKTVITIWGIDPTGVGDGNVLMRQFMMTIPVELEESARIDGANRFVTYSRILLPLVKPTLTTIAIFTFMNTWNDFMGPLLYLNDSSKYTLSLALRLFQQSREDETAMQMAASALVTLPVVIFFFLGQKHFIDGVVLTGMKA